MHWERGMGFEARAEVRLSGSRAGKIYLSKINYKI